MPKGEVLVLDGEEVDYEVSMADNEGRSREEMRDNKVRGRYAERAFELFCDERGLEFERVDENSHDYLVSDGEVEEKVEIKSRALAYGDDPSDGRDMLLRDHQTGADVLFLVAVDMSPVEGRRIAVVAGWTLETWTVVTDDPVGNGDRAFNYSNGDDDEELEKSRVPWSKLYDPADYRSGSV